MGGELSTIIMGFTIFCVVLGFLLGLLRGRNRSILRMIIVLGCAVGAFFLKDVLIKAIMSFEIEGQTIKDALVGAMLEGGELPEYLTQLNVSLVEVIVGLVCFLVIFFVLQFLSWIIVFPIFKIFVRRETKKKVLFGGIVGILQGVVVAFVICSPLTGAIVQVDKMSNLKFGEETVGEMVEIPDFSEYLASPLASIYTSTGSWFFNAITTYTDNGGNKVTLDDTVQAAETGTKVVEEVEKITSSLEGLNDPNSEKEAPDILRDVATSLSNIDEAIAGTSDGGKQVLQQVIASVGEMIKNEEGSGESSDTETMDKISEVIENIDVEKIDFGAAAEAVEGIADYLEKDEDEPIAPETVGKIVEGIAGNPVIIEMIPEDTQLVEIANEEDKQTFIDAIEDTELSDADKEKLKEILGLIG